ncbi:MAG: hypothetical protein KDC75_16420, partial [Phaeodactylibacter sp.]|nr:hypothetical protein [Phaeodactylibacter sp.]
KRSKLLFLLVSGFDLYKYFCPVPPPEECGMSDVSRQEVLAFLQQLEGLEPAAGLSQSYSLPVHLTIINDNNGQSPSPFVDIIPTMVDILNEMNGFFTNGMQFFLCGVSEVDNSAYYNMSLSNASTFTAQYNQPDVINLYLVRTLSVSTGGAILGAGSFPWSGWQGVIIHASGFEPRNVSHELGHYFGLLHTHQQHIQLLSNGSWNATVLPDQCLCCDCMDGDDFNDDCYDCGQMCDCNCTNSGDFFCDTPQDPSDQYCNCGTFPCVVNITLPNPSDPDNPIHFMETYYPDYSNLMSYYGGCRNKFSEEQLNRMKETLMEHPTRTHLIDEDMPSCDVFLANRGKVQIVQLGDNGGIELVPFRYNKVEIDEAGGAGFCEKTTGIDGFYNIQDCGLQVADADIEVSPQKDGTFPLELFSTYQVSTGDLVAIGQHILGIQSLPNSYAKIAADVNNSGSITTLDQIFIRRLILGIDNGFASVPSWRFVPDYALTFPSFHADFDDDPFSAEWIRADGSEYHYQEEQNYKSYLDLLDLNLLNPDITQEPTWSFRGVKMGNANLSSPDNPLLPGNHQIITDEHEAIQEGDEFTITVSAGGNNKEVVGYQFSLLFDPEVMEITGFEPGNLNSFTLDNFAVSEEAGAGILKTLWFSQLEEEFSFKLQEKPVVLFKIVARARVPITNLEPELELAEDAMAPEFYGAEGKLEDATLILDPVEIDPQKHRLLGVYPNPASGQLSFTIQSTEEEPIAITLFDQGGNDIVLEETTVEGVQTFQFQTLEGLQDGVVFYLIESEEALHSGYVIKY